MANDREEGTVLLLDFHKLDDVAGVIPCAEQDADTDEVVLVAYVNEQALRHTAERRLATFWSTSRGELWEKGATSGETFEVIEVLVNCEQNSLVYRVRPQRGGICHTRSRQVRPAIAFTDGWTSARCGWSGPNRNSQPRAGRTTEPAIFAEHAPMP